VLHVKSDLLLDIPRSEALKDCAAAVRVVGLDINAVVGIAFAAFTIGILLTGALWFIHTRTGRKPIKDFIIRLHLLSPFPPGWRSG